MPTGAITVGGLALPLDAGAQDTRIPDPLVDGLLDFLAFVLNADLNAKLANLRPTSAIAVPAGNTYPWNPTTRPQSLFARGKGDGAASPLPGLFVWRQSSKPIRFGQIRRGRETTIRVAYIAEQLVIPQGWEDRAGLLSAVEASIGGWIDNKYHPAYQGGANIAGLLGLAGTGLLFAGGTPSVLSPMPAAVGPDQPAVRGFPAYTATLIAQESTSQPGISAAESQPADLAVAIAVADEGELTNALTILQRVVPAPPFEEDV